eukprot:Platyproteum_vivax@DN3076_c0_g1_i1.p1
MRPTYLSHPDSPNFSSCNGNNNNRSGPIMESPITSSSSSNASVSSNSPRSDPSRSDPWRSAPWRSDPSRSDRCTSDSSHESFNPLSPHFSYGSSDSEEANRVPPTHECKYTTESEDVIRGASKKIKQRCKRMESRRLNRDLNRLRSEARKRSANRLQKEKGEEEPEVEVASDYFNNATFYRKYKAWKEEQERIEAAKPATHRRKRPCWRHIIDRLQKRLRYEDLSDRKRRSIKDCLKRLRMKERKRFEEYKERKAKRLKKLKDQQEFEGQQGQKVLKEEENEALPGGLNRRLKLEEGEIEQVQQLQKSLRRNLTKHKRRTIERAIFQIRKNARKRNGEKREKRKKGKGKRDLKV